MHVTRHQDTKIEQHKFGQANSDSNSMCNSYAIERKQFVLSIDLSGKDENIHIPKIHGDDSGGEER